MFVQMVFFPNGFMETLHDSKTFVNGFSDHRIHRYSSRAEALLSKQTIGCFLVRLSESRFGFSLSFRSDFFVLFFRFSSNFN